MFTICDLSESISVIIVDYLVKNRQTDRYFIDKNKSHYRPICHSNERDICTCLYKNVNLLKSYDNIHGMPNN